MVRDSNGVLVKSIKYPLIRWKEFFDIKFNHDIPFVTPEITDSLVEPYICNYKLPIEQEIISVIHKLKTNKTPGENGLQV